MPKKKDTHVFSTENSYMFYWPSGVLNKPIVIVEKPTSIDKNKILFHFSLGTSSESEYVKKSEILAVGDNVDGTIEVKGWSGKYRILNKKLFAQYLEKGVFELKKKP